MVADIVIAVAVAVAAWSGWRRGLLPPLLTQGGVLAVIGLLVKRPDLVEQVLPPGPIGLVVAVAAVVLVFAVLAAITGELSVMVQNVAVLRTIDAPLGLVVSGILQLVIVYVVALALASFDGITAPLHRATAIGPGQVAALRTAVSANPGARLVIDPAGLDSLAAASRLRSIPLDELDRYEPGLATYELKVRPQLASSILLGPILGLGEALPVFGRPQAPPLNEPRDEPPR